MRLHQEAVDCPRAAQPLVQSCARSPRLQERHFWIATKGQCLLNAINFVVQTLQFPTRRRNKEVQSAGIDKPVEFFLRRGFFDLHVG